MKEDCRPDTKMPASEKAGFDQGNERDANETLFTAAEVMMLSAGQIVNAEQT